MKTYQQAKLDSDGYFCTEFFKKATKTTDVYLFYLQENVQFVTWVTSAKFLI